LNKQQASHVWTLARDMLPSQKIDPTNHQTAAQGPSVETDLSSITPEQSE